MLRNYKYSALRNIFFSENTTRTRPLTIAVALRAQFCRSALFSGSNAAEKPPVAKGLVSHYNAILNIKISFKIKGLKMDGKIVLLGLLFDDVNGIVM